MAILCTALLLAGLMFMIGLYGVGTGRLKLSQTLLFEGGHARSAGLVLMSPLLLTLLLSGCAILRLRSGGEDISVLVSLISCLSIPTAIVWLRLFVKRGSEVSK
ncbi:MAG: hypothetical protein DPW09_22655 [Anaerolineae bacterium]|nr:hypothetical protein [Anaerolineales bacterium]MCQ3976239.1 hypothetical protein [Anaerolineae bacterium]